MPLTSDELKDAVRSYNKSDIEQDNMLRTTLNGTTNVLVKVCLVADWGSIPHFSFDDRILTARTIETPEIAKLLASPVWHFEEVGLIKKFLQNHHADLSKILKPPGARSRQLSFLSKYLHWCVSAAFPLWDNEARAAIHEKEGRDPADEASLDSYQTWVDEIYKLVTKHTVALAEVGLGTSPVRTLDKALWIIGKELRQQTARSKKVHK